MNENVTAIVLSSRKAGEKDKRLVLYTREAGRLGATAAGAFRPGARLGPATEPAVEARFRLWRSPGSSFGRITGGAIASSFSGLRSHWERMIVAGFLLEWTDRMTPWADPRPAKYDLLLGSLGRLVSDDPERVRLSFMVRFLTLAGYNLSRDVRGLGGMPGAADFLSDCAGQNLGDPPPVLPDGFPVAAFRQQLLRFVEPLLPLPLRSAVHEESLRDYSVSVSS